MSNTVPFLEICKGKSAEDIRALPDLEEHLDALKTEIGNYDPQTRESIETILKQLSHTVDNKIADLKTEMTKGKARIERTRKTTNACLAYIKSQKT